MPQALQLLRQAIFPANTLPLAAPPPPSPEQIQQIKRACAEALLSLLPAVALKHFFRDEENGVREIEGELEIWGDVYCNKHLLYGIVELVVVRVLPELGERGVKELLAERLGRGEGGGVGGGGVGRGKDGLL